MPVIPKTPVGVAVLLYRGWRRLPPQQRRQALALARRHGPTIAALAAAQAKSAMRQRRR
jgi:hypothetical protein